MRRRFRVVALGVIALAGLGLPSLPRVAAAQHHGSTPPPVKVVVPSELSKTGREGKAVFERHCVRCHGPNAAGTTQGPPLVHRVYEPGHHGDEGFRLAIKRGSRAHHWRFGDMPPVPGITDPEITAVIHYVRELQRANGIK